MKDNYVNIKKVKVDAVGLKKDLRLSSEPTANLEGWLSASVCALRVAINDHHTILGWFWYLQFDYRKSDVEISF